MRGDIAERQAELVRQNKELNERALEIEKFRQQQIASSSAFSEQELNVNEERKAQDEESVISIQSSDHIDIDEQSPPRYDHVYATTDINNIKVYEKDNRVLTNKNKPKMKEASELVEDNNKHDDELAAGVGLHATLRYQKARLRVLQSESDEFQAKIKNMHATELDLKKQLEQMSAEKNSLIKTCQQTRQLLEKHKEMTDAQEEKQRLLESQLAAVKKRCDELERNEKLTAQQLKSKDVRLNRALEDLEKAKTTLNSKKSESAEQLVPRSQVDRLTQDIQTLQKQKQELLLAYKKQMKLIDILKRQRLHMEAAKMLSFTEEEFSKTLELG